MNIDGIPEDRERKNEDTNNYLNVTTITEAITGPTELQIKILTKYFKILPKYSMLLRKNF